jgi:cytochrome c-type biogenesis protein CcmH
MQPLVFIPGSSTSGTEHIKMTQPIWGTLLRIAILLVLLSLLLAGTASAQDSAPSPPSDDEVNTIAKQLYCPVCENVPLDVCGTTACEQWRALIREKLAAGWTEEEIKTYFVNQYGDRVLAEPPRRGLNWLVYIVPPAAFLVGAYLLYRGLRSWHQPIPETEQLQNMEPLQDDEYVTRFEEQLEER